MKHSGLLFGEYFTRDAMVFLLGFGGNLKGPTAAGALLFDHFNRLPADLDFRDFWRHEIFRRGLCGSAERFGSRCN